MKQAFATVLFLAANGEQVVAIVVIPIHSVIAAVQIPIPCVGTAINATAPIERIGTVIVHAARIQVADQQTTLK